MTNEAEDILQDNIRELMDLLRSRRDETTTSDNLLAVAVGSSFDSNGDINDARINEMIRFIKSEPGAGIKEITDYMLSLLPRIETGTDGASA